MPHELLNAIKNHLTSPDTELNNCDEWGLVQKWLLVASQKDGGGGDPTKSKSSIALTTEALITNDGLIEHWISNRINSTLGPRPDVSLQTTVGMQGNLAVVQNMSGIIASKVGRELGAAMRGPQQSTTTGAGDEAKAYTQDQHATLLGFHGAMNVQYLRKIWRLFKSVKIPNYDHLRRAIKGDMLRWADNHRCWIKEGVYFDNKTLNEWINLKFNPGDSTTMYSSADNGISILKCRPPTSGRLKEMHWQEEIWDATKGNAIFVEMTKQLKKDVSAPTSDFGGLRSNIATFCALLFTLFGEGCDLYKSIVEILQIFSHQFSMQNKSAYTPEVCHRITWAIIVDSCSFFNDIKLAEDFLESGQYIQFPVSMLQGDYMAIKHGIKIQCHNFPQEWITKEFPTPTGSYYGGGRGGGYQVIPPGIPLGTPPTWGKPIAPSKFHQRE